MAPELETSDFVTAVLGRIDQLEDRGVSPSELLHSMMFVVSVMCKSYDLDIDTALDLQRDMLRKVDVVLGGTLVVDGDAEA